MTVSPKQFKRFYPDASRSGTLFFYGWMRRTLVPPFRVLSLGAGPGDPTGTEEFDIRDMRSAMGKVHGCDPDPKVLNNAQLDHAMVMEAPPHIPFPDGMFDLVYSDYVLEHVEHPEGFLKEVFRVLKPGGSFFFRTPNVWHYVSITALVLPHWAHERLANKARRLGADAHHPYPTYYRMNTRRKLRRLCTGAGLSNLEMVMFEGEPSYLVFNTLAFLVGVAYERATNSTTLLSGMRANIIGRAVK